MKMKVIRKLVYSFSIFSLIILLGTVQFLEQYRRTKSLQHPINITQLFPEQIFKHKDKCSDWNFPEEMQVEKNPRIVLDPNRFFYPGLIWGPNNQVIGLQHSVYLTIRLNRTLVVPPFHAHWNRPGKLNPYEFIDVKRLCSFVSCISVDQLRKRCNKSFDVAFEAKQTKMPWLRKFERDTEMSVIYPTRILNITHARKLRIEKGQSDIPTLPQMAYIRKYGETMPMKASVLQAAFDTTAPCAIYAAVFDPIDAYPRNGIARPLDPNIESSGRISDDVLYSAVLDAVGHPPCLVKAATSYIRDVMNNEPFIGVHWRYDYEDWVSRACSGAILTSVEIVCQKVKKIKPIHIAKAIKKSFKAKTSTFYETAFAYIATPPTMKTFKDSIYLELKKLDSKFARPARSVEDYIKDRYQLCWKNEKWNNLYSILSLIEMEIMKQSSLFLYSPRSTWSEKIRLHRVELDQEGNSIKKLEIDVLAEAIKEVGQ